MKAYSIVYILMLNIALIFCSCGKDEDDSEDWIEKSGESYGTVCRFQKYMKLAGNDSGAQASACYADFMVQAYSDNDIITIYDIKEKRYLSTVKMNEPGASKYIHCNSIAFGNQRYNKSDFFPTLYVCSGYKIYGKNKIYAYRLTMEDDEFSTELIQTISLDGFGTWTEALFDNENNYLWIRHNGGNHKFNVPDIHDGNVSINIDEQIESLSFENTVASNYEFGDWQAQTFYKDRFNFVSGVPSRGQNLAFVSISTIKKELDIVIDFKDLGLAPKNTRNNHYEPEGVFFYNGNCMICFPSYIYKFVIDGI